MASFAAAMAKGMPVIGIRGCDLGNNWKQRAFAEARAAIAQLGERQTEDLKVPGSIPGLGNVFCLRYNIHVTRDLGMLKLLFVPPPRFLLQLREARSP